MVRSARRNQKCGAAEIPDSPDVVRQRGEAELRAHSVQALEQEVSTVDPSLDRSDFDGLTCYVPEAREYRMTVDGVEVDELCHNGPDETGKRSISIPWKPLLTRIRLYSHVVEAKSRLNAP